MNGFLDTGVVIAYCFLFDIHHRNCRDYVEERKEDGDDLYVSPDVEDEYRNKKTEVAERLSEQVLEHRRFVKRNVDEDELGPMEIDEMKKSLRRWDKDASEFLAEYYDKQGNFVAKRDVLEDLRDISREIEHAAVKRKRAIDSVTETWTKQGEYPELRTVLSMIHSSDLEICLTAHDVACHVDGSTEFATTNPTDFVDDGREEVILEHTQIDDIVDLSRR